MADTIFSTQSVEFGRLRSTVVLLLLLLAALLAWWWMRSTWEQPLAAAVPASTTSVERAQTSLADPPAKGAPASTKANARASAKTSAPASVPISLSAKVLGVRATLEQRESDSQRMLAATDLAPLLEEFKRRAAHGDADAAARMRDIYEECVGALSFRLPTATKIEPAFTFGPERLPIDHPLRVAALAHIQNRCANVLPGTDQRQRTILTVRALFASQRLAADLGDLHARIAEQPSERDAALRAQRRREYARLLLQSGAPEDLLALSQRVPDGTRFSSEAWVLAACASGHECTNIHNVRQQWCAQSGIECATQSLPEFIQHTLPPRAWRRTLAERDEILAARRAGDTEGMLRPLVPVGGGG